ncbi:alpha/beta hydrolase [Bifidobacterium sp. B4107]|uniref:alpha/beta fold hydrolase n=1 Tax=unclassified Bifidobacterium TaxID=2608897 RepID=UPI00226B2C79|nr:MULTISPECIES: alpha/beta hydrolase [unclassified Bifidobacterium]MCX8648523.1 alpha/beta hydrolase [Bifidobacterium sp. B4107]MCX8652720.1 alpha/beta hydrolase [Bifidobacterium sp. B4111]MCX8659153.1 alpha/beta hydrolase [Bifidobacterium sp. B4114]
MPYAHNGDISIYYEKYGPVDGPALIMIEGYTAQLVGWDKGFVQKLNDLDIQTILLDNRDVGLSSQTGTPDQTDKTYDITDMANDVLAVADAEKLKTFNIMGESMGGMITQEVLVDYPNRINSAVIMFTAPSWGKEWMSNADSAESGNNAGLDVASNRDQAIDLFVSREKACHVNSAYPFNEEKARQLGAMTYDRCYRPDGWRRQQAATNSFSLDQNKLGELTLPAAIIHGRRDPFFSPKAGIRISRLLRNSELHIYPGMAHEIPEPLWDEFAQITLRTIQQGESGRG